MNSCVKLISCVFLTWPRIVLLVSACAFSYVFMLAIYRLYLSPLAPFPGPILARVTHWYEFYYNVVHTGKYYEKIRELHDKYGPVVRVTPEEIHIMEPSAYRDIFVMGAPSDYLGDPNFNSEWYETLKRVHSDLVESEFGNGGFPRLAQLIQQAGAHNVSHTLGTIIAYLLMDPKKLEPLRKELEVIWSEHDNKSTAPTWLELEKAPYLSGMNRSPRVFPDDDVKICGWVIPRGTPISMTTYWMHNDPAVFLNPESFEPNRWLTTDANELKTMQAYYVPFSLGSRSCIYHTISRLFRPDAPKLSLHKTARRDIVAIHGLLFPMPPFDSKGVRVTVSE
ncbi:putative cytochrome P450 monooxygenase [Xylaria flabelliformis]|nr:putative cytochrome P450 monooxygenase [Xylaria flabelliformis]